MASLESSQAFARVHEKLRSSFAEISRISLTATALIYRLTFVPSLFLFSSPMMFSPLVCVFCSDSIHCKCPAEFVKPFSPYSVIITHYPPPRLVFPLDVFHTLLISS